MINLIKKVIIAGTLLFTLTGCSVSTEEEVDPKTLDFTGRDSVGQDTAFDHTNGVEINSDQTGDHLGDKRMRITSTEQDQKIRNSRTNISIEEVTADQVALIADVSEAIILETDNNAFVAVKLEPGSDSISLDLRNKIKQVVTSNVEHADAVHASNNPEFYQRMESYASYVKNQKPTDEYIHDFSETIRRVFPDAR